MALESSRVTLPFRIVAAQAGVAVLVAGLWSLAGLDRGVSSALGGVAVIVPNAFFAWRVTARADRPTALDQARRLVGNSVAKFVLGAGLLVAVFVWCRPEPIAFFATLIAVQVTHLMAPLLDVPRRSRAAKEEP
jgi:F0F1-type ATP synthase assembly protein I